MLDLFVTIQTVKMPLGHVNQMEFLLVFDSTVFFQMTGQTPCTRNDPAALCNLAVAMDTCDVSFVGYKVLVTERFIHECNLFFRYYMTSQTFTCSDLFVAPTIEMASQTRGLANADMLALYGLSMTTHTVQRLSIRMFTQMFVVAELDLVIEHDRLTVVSGPFVATYLLAGCTADITVRFGAIGAGNILN
jgi:hypothetical protein